ncbi:MAG: hypothetical protein QE271_11515 [Bacteriovoracaceae bacterium]|nr:hypothetical protein [Bacteriovoracaceae bacterium]
MKNFFAMFMVVFFSVNSLHASILEFPCSSEDIQYSYALNIKLDEDNTSNLKYFNFNISFYLSILNSPNRKISFDDFIDDPRSVNRTFLEMNSKKEFGVSESYTLYSQTRVKQVHSIYLGIIKGSETRTVHFKCQIANNLMKLKNQNNSKTDLSSTN